jgi:hypothetical protein
LLLIEQAIANNTPLAIRYDTAGRGALTDRVVDPLRLEWHGDVPYLIAWRRLRQDERVFRVERIVEIGVEYGEPINASQRQGADWITTSARRKHVGVQENPEQGANSIPPDCTVPGFQSTPAPPAQSGLVPRRQSPGHPATVAPPGLALTK